MFYSCHRNGNEYCGVCYVYRPPSPPPQRAYRHVITSPVPASNNMPGFPRAIHTGESNGANHVDIHIHTVVSNGNSARTAGATANSANTAAERFDIMHCTSDYLFSLLYPCDCCLCSTIVFYARPATARGSARNVPYAASAPATPTGNSNNTNAANETSTGAQAGTASASGPRYMRTAPGAVGLSGLTGIPSPRAPLLSPQVVVAHPPASPAPIAPAAGIPLPPRGPPPRSPPRSGTTAPTRAGQNNSFSNSSLFGGLNLAGLNNATPQMFSDANGQMLGAAFAVDMASADGIGAIPGMGAFNIGGGANQSQQAMADFFQSLVLPPGATRPTGAPPSTAMPSTAMPSTSAGDVSVASVISPELSALDSSSSRPGVATPDLVLESVETPENLPVESSLETSSEPTSLPLTCSSNVVSAAETTLSMSPIECLNEVDSDSEIYTSDFEESDQTAEESRNTIQQEGQEPAQPPAAAAALPASPLQGADSNSNTPPTVRQSISQDSLPTLFQRLVRRCVLFIIMVGTTL